MDKFNYSNLTPFKWFVLQNFPFIEAQFDAITNWQLFEKLGREINKIINSENTLGSQVEDVTNAFIELQTYVNNYFKNLDVQDEINNKLDEMAESGELETIISAYLNSNCIVAFNTLADLKASNNMSDNMFTRTFGKNSYNDGLGSLYKIRTLGSGEVIDEVNLVSLTNYNNLVAEKINQSNDFLAFNTLSELKNGTSLINGMYIRTFGKNSYNDGLGSLYKIRTLTNNDVVDEINIVSLTNFNDLVAEKIYQRNPFNNKKYLFVGDSLAWGYQGANVDPITGFFELVTDKFNLNSTIVCYPGYGFEGASSGYTWQNLIESRNLKNKEEYTDIIIMGGDNDNPNASIFTSITTTINYLKSNFKNATIHLGCIGRKSDYDNVAQCQNRRIINKIYQNSAYNNGIKYIEGSWLILHHKSYYIADKTHLNANGENQVAYCLGQYILNGRIDDFLDINDPTTDFKTDTMVWDENVTPFGGTVCYSYIDKNNTFWRLAGGINFVENPSVGYNTDMVIGQLTNSYITSSIYNQGLNSTFRVVLLTAENTYKACSVNIYNDYQNKIHLKFFTFLDSGNFNNVAIQKIFFDSYAFTMIADSKYC